MNTHNYFHQRPQLFWIIFLIILTFLLLAIAAAFRDQLAPPIIDLKNDAIATPDQTESKKL